MEWGHINESARDMAKRVHNSGFSEYGLLAVSLILLGILIGQHVPRTRKSAVLMWIAVLLTFILTIYRVYIYPCIFSEED